MEILITHNHDAMQIKPRLLHETAEIALTEIKRFLEPRLTEILSLRRVTAPMYLPTDSPLLDRRFPGAVIRLKGADQTVEIVGSLDVWLRGQLARYDIAPGFGVYTIMNALRPDLPENSTSAPHIAAWAWQQAVDTVDGGEKLLATYARKLHHLLVDTEKMVVNLFPHMHPTLGKELKIIHETQLAEMYPEQTPERSLYRHMHPGKHQPDETDNPAPIFLLIRDPHPLLALGEIWTWNRILGKPVCIADIASWPADRIAGPSVGGNIYRGTLALQILQQDKML